MASTSYLSPQPVAVAVIPSPVDQAPRSPQSQGVFAPFRLISVPMYSEHDPLAPELRRGSLQNSRLPSIPTDPSLQVPFVSRRLSMPVISRTAAASQLLSLPLRLPSTTEGIATIRRISVIVEQITDKGTLPPLYSPTDDKTQSPAYEKINRHPETLSKHLFKLGFLCPLLWIIAIMIMTSPPALPSAASFNVEEEFKTLEERTEEIEILRAEETKWGRRSLLALVLFVLLLASIVALVLYFVGKHTSSGSGVSTIGCFGSILACSGPGTGRG